MTKRAELLRDYLPGFNGHAAFYRMVPPITGEDYDGGKFSHEFVIVSAADVMFSGPETYIFPATKEGKVADWGELDGSQRGTLRHGAVLEDLGYTIHRVAE